MEGRWECRVEWQGYPGQDTWEPIHNIIGGADGALNTFKDSTAGAWEAGGSRRASGRGRGRGRGRHGGRGRSRKIAKVQQEDQSEDEEEEDSSA